MINLWYNISVNKTRVNLQNKITGGNTYERNQKAFGYRISKAKSNSK